MTWVAADTSGTPIVGFEYGTPVTWTDGLGTKKTGTIVVQGTDKIGDVHKIRDDADPKGLMVPVATGLVQRLG